MVTFKQQLDPTPPAEIGKCFLVPVTQLYRGMINVSEPAHLFTIKDDDKDPSLIWTVLMHPGTYIGTFGMIFAVCMGVYCFKRFRIEPATSRHPPYSPFMYGMSSQYVIVDDNVEVAPIYRCTGKVEEPRRPHKNHDLHTEWEAARPECHCKQPAFAKGILITGSLAPKAQILGMQ